MTIDQILTVLVLIAVVAALIWDKIRADVVALSGAAVLLMTGVVRPVDVQGAFASPAIIALASLFVIAYALELSGLLDAAIERAVRLSKRLGAMGLWILLTMVGSVSCFLNSTPIVVLMAPVVRDVANALKLSPKRFLIPLSYITVLTGCCTLIGTSTNLLVDDMASLAGQPRFGIFEITPVGLPVALVGGLYLFLFSGKLLGGRYEAETREEPSPPIDRTHVYSAQVGNPELFTVARPLQPVKAIVALLVFVSAVALAAAGVAPIAATAFAGAVLLILLRVLTADEAYSGLRPQILILIAGMVVIGIAMEKSGLAALSSDLLISSVEGLSPLIALMALYLLTSIITELLSNATVAVLMTPVAVALAESMAVSPRPFLVAVMMAASVSFATPFGYQTNVIVYQMGGYRYMDFFRIGMPLNVIAFVVSIIAIRFAFPF
ncbi:MAG: SLC13 family permease [Novosphingobium sp.]